ncbi:MAG: rRNA methyltransferase [Aeropyrum sp.]|nr:rRNA methyltransferase [Aeropyrum sp.]MCE4615758.1 rRNA methyltransferase [Aeropyrum sp.]
MERLRLVVVGVEGAVNLGFLARLAENFDVDELHLVAPVASIEEARRYAARAAVRLDSAIITQSLDKALDGVSVSICTSSHMSVEDTLRIPLTPWEAAELAASAPGTVALVLGRESVGLTREELAKCNAYSSIPASPKYPSLNLSNAAAIYLYEIYRARGRGRVAREPASQELLRLIEAYARALAGRVAREERLEEVVVSVARLAAKSVASRREVENLLYLLARACRHVEGCSSEVPRYLQPGD